MHHPSELGRSRFRNAHIINVHAHRNVYHPPLSDPAFLYSYNTQWPPNTSKHQVVIVGGGITGLTLALMLQHLQIDYVLLEAYKSVTPNVGASIGLYANGLRILDQLGVYQDVCNIAQSAKVHFVRDGETGQRLTKVPCGPILKTRHGYAPMFMERYELLRVLYKHIAEKERIVVNKKVQKIEDDEGRVLVHTEDGTTFEGQITVGADGVHSTVRREMWRNAEENDPAAIPTEDKQSAYRKFPPPIPSSQTPRHQI